MHPNLFKIFQKQSRKATWQIGAEIIPGVRNTEVNRVIKRSSQAIVGQQDSYRFQLGNVNNGMLSL